jgi:hypothetical protein
VRVGLEADGFTTTEEMKIMAGVEHSSPGFRRERENEKESRRHEHSKRDVREDRAEDSGDE